MSHSIPPEVIQAAKDTMRRWKVPASISLAQYALESAWGTKTSGPNNFFGMKAKWDEVGVLRKTHEFYKGQMIATTAMFRAFGTPQEAFEAHGHLLATSPCYHAAQHCLHYRAYAHALTGVYATDPHYGDKLIQLIESAGLDQYDTA